MWSTWFLKVRNHAPYLVLDRVPNLGVLALDRAGYWVGDKELGLVLVKVALGKGIYANTCVSSSFFA